MNNPMRILAMEFMLSLAVVSWAPIKKGYYPWPPTIMRSAIAYAILSFVALVDDTFAAVLGGGFLLAQIIGALNKGNLPDYIFTNLQNDSAFKLYGLQFDGNVGNQSLNSTRGH